ncbi:MAG: hypothetical protein ACTHK8_14310 [Ginsengibacter sp.]
MNEINLSRKELYKLVWKKSMLSLSKNYEISDTGLRKICIRMQIPVPPLGYWAKLRFGKKVRQVPLPAMHKREGSVSLKIRNQNNSLQTVGKHSSEKLKIIELENDNRLNLQLEQQLNRPVALVALSKSVLLKVKPDTITYKGTVNCTYKALDIRVASANIERGLLLFDTLIKALEIRGHTVKLVNFKTRINICGEEFDISLREKMRKEMVHDGNWTRQIFYPKGVLAFIVGSYSAREFKDGKVKLEQQLLKIIAHLELESARRIEERRIRQEAEERRKEKERLEKELEERIEKELIKFKKLLSDSERWHKVEILRNYISELERKMEDEEEGTMEKIEWLNWAKKKADWYDPFIENKDELLEAVNQNTLEFVKAKRNLW